MKTGVVVFPGINRDRDMAIALTRSGATPRMIWHKDTDLTGLDLIVVPGGIIEILDRIIQDEASQRVRYHYVLIDFVCQVTGGTLCSASDAEDVRWVEHGQLRTGYQLAPATLAVIDKAFRVSVSGPSAT